jgi:hypothetical protein
MIKLPAAEFFHETVSLKLLKHFSKKRESLISLLVFMKELGQPKLRVMD